MKTKTNSRHHYNKDYVNNNRNMLREGALFQSQKHIKTSRQKIKYTMLRPNKYILRHKNKH